MVEATNAQSAFTDASGAAITGTARFILLLLKTRGLVLQRPRL